MKISHMVAKSLSIKGQCGDVCNYDTFDIATPVCNECGDILYEYEIDEN